MTLAELMTRRDELRRMRDAAVREVAHGERKVVYRSDAEMAAALADVERRIRAAEGRRPVSEIRITGSKGL